jgi:uncharacterized membrane protein
MAVALVASLAINLLVAGAIAGHFLSGRHHAWHGWGMMRGEVDRMPDRPGERVIGRMAAALPSENRAAFEAAMEQHRQPLAEAGRGVRDARTKVRDAMAAEPFDRARLESSFAELRARSQQLQTAVHGAVADAAAKLPPEARAKLAQFNRSRRAR